MGSMSRLCDYSSSDEDVNIPLATRLPSPNLPTLGITKSIAREPQRSNLPEKSELRNFPHEPGNWATFVAIPISIPPETLDVIDTIYDTLASLSVNKIEDYHISLTRVLVLRHHWISGFIKSLEHVIHDVPSFPISFQGFSVYQNDNNTKTFIAINVQYGDNLINDIIDNIDKCLLEYNLPIYYSPRSLHLSVLWCLGNVKDKLELLLETMSLDTAFPVSVKHCICKTGNKLFNIPFATYVLLIYILQEASEVYLYFSL